MKKYYLALSLAAAANLSLADSTQIYKWTDSNGNVHFSDKPAPGAEEIKLPQIQTYSSPKQPAESENSSAAATDEEEAAYELISIAQPNDQETIRNTEGYVPIIVDLKPMLKKGDNVQLIFDGKPLDTPQPTTTFTLQGIERGSHTIAAQVMDSQGNVLKTSDSITIYMMPPRVGMSRGNR